MQNYTHVESIQKVAKYISYINSNPNRPDDYKIKGPVKFRGTIKIHGANSGVSLCSKSIKIQSRTHEITPGQDNYGFGRFMASQDAIAAMRALESEVRSAHKVPLGATITFYGEWCGRGINKGTAINNFDGRQLVLFAVKSSIDESSEYIDAIAPLGDRFKDLGIYSVMDVAPVYIYIDFEDKNSVDAALQKLSELKKGLESKCPWGERFGLEGPGEGLVFIPVQEHWGKSDLFFKIKTESHKNVKASSPSVSLEPEVLDSIEKFLDYSLTDSRMEQGLEFLNECNKDISMESMGEFLKWISQDVKRECSVELDSNDLDWKLVSKPLTQRAVQWFKAKAEAI